MKFILGKKIGMTQMFNKEGKITPVTLVEAGPCVVLQKKTKEREGYDSLQVGFIKIEKKSKIGKSMKGKEYRHIREFSIINDQLSKNVGDEMNVSQFTEGDK